jgi:hypothetical protein
MITTAAAMPETPVNEDRETILSENKIRLAEDILMSAPANDAMQTKQFYQD